MTSLPLQQEEDLNASRFPLFQPSPLPQILSGEKDQAKTTLKPPTSRGERWLFFKAEKTRSCGKERFCQQLSYLLSSWILICATTHSEIHVEEYSVAQNPQNKETHVSFAS